MRLGILNAFPPGEEKINWQDTPVDAYIRFFERASPLFSYVGYDVAKGQFPDTPHDCDVYVITGSPRGVYDSDKWIAGLSEFIHDAYHTGVKLVGICFGHQILANALGGCTEKSEKSWGLGLKPFDIFRGKPWMVDQPKTCSLYFIHQDQVVQLPPNAELLGGSDFCPNALFVIGNQVLGIQGYPEFTAEIMADIFQELEKTIDRKLYETALCSMKNDRPDNQRFA